MYIYWTYLKFLLKVVLNLNVSAIQIFQHSGRGIDVRRRKIWDMYGPETHLEVLWKCMSVLLIRPFIHLFIVSDCIDASVRKHAGYWQLSEGTHGFGMMLPISPGGKVSCKGNYNSSIVLYPCIFATCLFLNQEPLACCHCTYRYAHHETSFLFTGGSILISFVCTIIS